MRFSLACCSATLFSAIFWAPGLAFAQNQSGQLFLDKEGTYFRLQHNSGQFVGQDSSYTTFGMFHPIWLENGLIFIDGQFVLDNDSHSGASIAAGYRFTDAYWSRVYGASVAYDWDNDFMEAEQIVVSLESLGEIYDARANINIPISGKTENLGPAASAGALLFSGMELHQDTSFSQGLALTGFNAEVGRLISYIPEEYDARAYVGGYYYEESGLTAGGVSARVHAALDEGVGIGLRGSYDDEFGGSISVAIDWTFPHLPFRTYADEGQRVRQRMLRPVERSRQVVLAARKIEQTEALTSGGTPISIAFVNDDGVGTGTGTFEDPFGSLTDAAGSTADIVYLEASSNFSGQQITLASGQRLLGEGLIQLGGGSFQLISHSVSTEQLGDVELPQFSPIAATRSVPTLSNSVGTAAVSVVGDNEVSGLILDGGNRGVAALSGAANSNINYSTISGMAVAGIEITPSTDTTINFVDFSNNTIDVILNSSGTTISNVNSTGATGGSISLENVSGTTTLENINIGTAGGFGGIVLDKVAKNSQVALTNISIDTATNGITISEAKSGVNVDFESVFIENVSSTGVDLLQNQGTFTFSSGSLIDDAGFSAFNINGGVADVTFNGHITQTATGSTVSITDHSQGTVSFPSGTIITTAGNGLQFDNADGTYIFESIVKLSGGSAGIDILNGHRNANDDTASFTFLSGTTITDRTTRNFAELPNVPDASFIIIKSSAAVTFSGTIDRTVANPDDPPFLYVQDRKNVNVIEFTDAIFSGFVPDPLVSLGAPNNDFSTYNAP